MRSDVWVRPGGSSCTVPASNQRAEPFWFNLMRHIGQRRPTLFRDTCQPSFLCLIDSLCGYESIRHATATPKFSGCNLKKL